MSGIGFVIVKWFVVEGVFVVIVDVDFVIGEVVVVEVGGVFCLVDVVDEVRVNVLFDGVVVEFGWIDIVFNNVGILLVDDDLIEIMEFLVWDWV